MRAYILEAIMKVLPEEEFFARDLVDPLEEVLNERLDAKSIAWYLGELSLTGLVVKKRIAPWKPMYIYRRR